MHQGIILIDKPAGWTSFDAVNYVRGVVARAEGKKPKAVKVGHSGTLDPFATGLLVLLIGSAYTKQAASLTKQDKVYTFSLHLGQKSTTGDPEGEIVQVSDYQPTASEVKGVLQHFTGEIEQIPPQFSAIKVGGKRAYDLARAGKSVQLEPRPVTIHNLELINLTYPEVNLSANVSSGTYIRSLGEDIGKSLGTDAYVTTLRRESIGKYNVSNATEPKILNEINVASFITEL